MPSPRITTLDDVVREQSRARTTMKFSGQIEDLYRAESVQERRSYVVVNWLTALLIYDTYIMIDYIVSGGDFSKYLIVRFGIVTPISVLLIGLSLNRNRFFDFFCSLLPILFSLSLTCLIIVGHGNYRISYLFTNVLIMIGGAVINRSSLVYASTTVGVQGLAFFAAMQYSDVAGADDRAVSVLFCLSGAIVTIMTACVLEITKRRSFLLGLRVRLLNDQLTVLSMADPLTGLGNRRFFEDATSRFWAKDSVTKPVRASLVLLDIDHFKTFNDSQGHSAGDLCLKTIGERIAATIREGDVAVRFGGEEIIVFLPDTDFTDARRLAETVRLAILDLAIPHRALGPSALVTASFGVATSLCADRSPSELVVYADTALYAAKHNGRNQVWPPIGPIESPWIGPIEDHGRLSA